MWHPERVVHGRERGHERGEEDEVGAAAVRQVVADLGGHVHLHHDHVKLEERVSLLTLDLKAYYRVTHHNGKNLPLS